MQKDNKKYIWSWAMYDFANSAFTTLVVTFIYSAFFTTTIAANETEGTTWWSLSISATAIFVAISSPFIGALADGSFLRKRIMIFSTVLCAFFTSLLFFIDSSPLYAIIIFTLANIAFEVGSVFYNSYLPDISTKDKVGRVSGFGWGLGYLGGLLALLLSLFFLVEPETAPFGLNKEEGQHILATNLLVAIWFLIFSLPLFLVIKDKESKKWVLTQMVVKAYQDLYQTFKDLKKYKAVQNFLIARLVYNDALVTVFALGGIYASVTIGFSFEEILLLGIVLNIMAGLGAFVFGLVDDKWGSKKVIKVSILFMMLASFFAVLAPDLPGLCQLAFGGDAVPDFYNTKNIFWLSGIMIGFFAGPIQSSSRALMTRITPTEKKNEFFGFYAFSGKATAFLGPLIFAWASDYFNTQQMGLLMIFLLFCLGYVLIKRLVR